ncbi:GntR family transcriptional regulator [Plastorhodobacter daqingensis]|uniref:GntR family transcriptional regulator n=1 Tax=Plastorhodobacter daqingensis TaxID=1387281 RepID=A0ABW2UI90_9RHOB
MGIAEEKNHGQRALAELRRRILRGELPGGMRLLEVHIADQLEISRTPVREAMSRLVEEGLLERLQNGGFMVRSFTAADVIDAIELRGVVEGTAARLAAERGVPEDRMQAFLDIIEQLDACFPGSDRAAVDFERYAELNADLHAALASLSGSKIIAQEVARATRLPFASPSAFIPNRAAVEAFEHSLHLAQEQHRRMGEAIRNREGARAEALVREHARIARGNLEYILSQDRSLMSQVPALSFIIE